jgi:sugar O-acyltransferase (sialic acid O-acetyltransferase NeuD family)
MKKALIGYGGHAREVISQIDNDLICFIDDIFIKENNSKILPLSKFNPNEYEVMIAIGDSLIRKDIIKKLPPNTKYFTFIHPSAQLFSKDIKIGKGTFIGANCILTTNISIGAHCILNRGNHIGHDTDINDFFSAMPNAVVSGNCNIGNCVYMGTNSTVKEKIDIRVSKTELNESSETLTFEEFLKLKN